MTRARFTATLLLAIIGFAAALTGIWDTDFFHHLATGRAIAHCVSFARDPFLFPFEGQPSSPPPYWLGSLLLYLSSLPGELVGPQILVALVTAAVCALLVRDGLEDRGSARDVAIASALVLLAIPELRVRSAPRPEAFGVLFVAYTLLALRRYELGRARLLFAFPLVVLVWNQVHVSVAIGLGLVGLHVAWTLVRAACGRLGLAATGAAFREALPPLVVLGIGLGLSAVTPSAESPARVSLVFLARLLGSTDGRALSAAVDVNRVFQNLIEELRAPSTVDWLRPFGVLVVLALGSFAVHRSKHWGRELATVLAFTYLTSTSFRFATYASVAAAPIAARNLLGWLDSLALARPRLARAIAPALALLGVARAATAPTLALQPATLALDLPSFPVRASEYLRQIGFEGRLYNEFGAGGYLEWTWGRKVFQDGRGMVKAEDAPLLFPEPIDRARLSRLDARWRFDALVISTRPPVAGAPGIAERIANIWATSTDPATWSLVALDEGAALFLRRNGRWAPEAARDEYRFVKPGVIVPGGLLSEPSGAGMVTAELERLVREAPACVQCRTALAGTLLQAGRLADAAPHLEVLDRTDSARARPTIDLLLATRAQMQGDSKEAERRFRDAIRRSPDPAPLRTALAMQLLDANRDAAASDLIAENLTASRTAADLGLAALLARRAGDGARAAALEQEAAVAGRRELALARSLEGHRLMDAGRLAEARTAFVEASALDGTTADPLVGLGYLELLSGHSELSAATFERAVRLAPEDPDAWHGLGLASEASGRPERAAEAYRASVRARPSGPIADDARGRLRALGAR